MVTGIVISLITMITLDTLFTWYYLFRKKWENLNVELFKAFPTFTIYRSLSVHWLSFSVTLSYFIMKAHQVAGIPITSVQTVYFIVVVILMSYIHSILEYYLILVKLEPLSNNDIQREFNRRANHISLATKISRITIFVGVIPLILMTFTFYLKLVEAESASYTIHSLIRELTIWGSVYGLVAIIMSMVLVRILARDISQGAWRLSEGFRKLALGEKMHRIEVDTSDEFENLALSFNSLVTELENKETIFNEFGRLVDPKIRDLVLAGNVKKSGSEHHGVVLFCDIADFTPITERLEAEELIAFLNQLIYRIVKTILKHQGTVNKFMGDAILAFWNLPKELINPELIALQCALELQEEIDLFNVESKDFREAKVPPILPIRLGIGLSSGKMIAGTIGAEQRREYTVIGSNVNLSSRLQQHTRQLNVDLLVSESIYQSVQKCPKEIREGIEFEFIGKVLLKGLTHPQEIYGVKSNSPRS